MLNMGVSDTLDRGIMKITFSKDPKKDRFGGTVVIKNGDKDYYLTARDKLKAGKSDIETSDSYKVTAHYTQSQSLGKELETYQKTWDMMGE